MRSALADRLMKCCANNSRIIAEQWYKALCTNTRTQAFSSMHRESCIRHAEFVYKNLEKIYFDEKPESTLAHLLDIEGFVEDHYARSIPLEQVIYSIVLLRRHLWLYAESQAIYEGIGDMLQMVESVNRVLLVCDYLMFIVAHKYRSKSAPAPG